MASKYVYGVVRAKDRAKPKGKGIADKPLKVVAADGLGALTSDVPGEELEAGRDELLTHSRVLEEALGDGVVLPMRFGVVMPDEDTVRAELLDPHREQLEAQLEEMSGKVEMNVKAIYDEAAILQEILDENPDIARGREKIQGRSEDATYYERIDLGERIVGALQAKREADERAIVDGLAPRALEVEVSEPMHERMAVNASFLVDEDRLEEFDAELDRIAESHGGRLRFKATGPLPPHSFVELSLEA
jgi:Gas vesicle synthesis protein GvpL/GvpF